MFNYTVKVLHNKIKNKFRVLQVSSLDEIIKIKNHFDVFVAIPTKKFISKGGF